MRGTPKHVLPPGRYLRTGAPTKSLTTWRTSSSQITYRTRTFLKKLLKKSGNLFMPKGMKIAGTVKTENHIDLKEGYKVQH